MFPEDRVCLVPWHAAFHADFVHLDTEIALLRTTTKYTRLQFLHAITPSTEICKHTNKVTNSHTDREQRVANSLTQNAHIISAVMFRLCDECGDIIGEILE